jgi:Cys-rich protein (TIGR01571 family)
MNESFQAVVLHKTQVAKAELVGSGATNTSNTSGSSRTKLNFHIPTGRWRDGIFDCFIIEPIHSQCCLTYCLPDIALGQIMSRLNLTSCGNPSNTPRSERGYCQPFYIMYIIVFSILFFNFVNFQASIIASAMSASPDKVSFNPNILNILVTYAAVIYIIVVHTKTRNQLRRKYRIGTDQSCLGDCCCATFCSAYSICQMARHTAEYHHTHRARCCTETGLDEEWDEYDYETSTEGHSTMTSPQSLFNHPPFTV